MGPLARRWPALAILLLAISCASPEAALDRQYEAARLDVRRGQLDAALAGAREGMQAAASAGDPVRAWRFRLLAADALTGKLELDEASALLREEVPSGAEFDAVRARRDYQTAYLLVAQGKLRDAAPLVDAALAAEPADAGLRLDLEMLQAQLLYRTGRAPAADALLADARTREGQDADPYQQAQLAITTGMGLVTRGRYDEALPHFSRVLALPGLDDTTIHGRALNNAGLCHARLGQFDQAVSLQQRAVQEQQPRGPRDYSQALGELGNTYLLKRDIERGTDYLRQAFTIAADSGLDSDAALWARNLAAAYVAMGRWDDASQFNAQAARLGTAAGAGGSPYETVTAARVAMGRGQLDEAAPLFTSALEDAAATPGVRWMAHTGLARLAARTDRPAEAARQFEAALQTLEQTRSAVLRADYRISFTSRLIEFYDAYVEFLMDQGQAARALEVADSSRARVLAERQGVAVGDGRARVPALQRLARARRAAMLFYWLGPEQSWVWVVTGQGVRSRALPAAPGITALVDAYQQVVQNPVADPLASDAGRDLYTQLVAPVAADLPPDATIVVVPDGALHRINFETLPVPGARPHYWIEDATIQIAPSLAMLQGVGAGSALPSAAAPASLLLVGNPTPRAPEFPALSYAPAEMERVASHFPSRAVTEIVGEDATPAAFRDAQPGGFAAIHFTSHAVANVESPLDSAVILSGPEQSFKLYARDVATLPLTADLVTVSACRSAGDRAYAGEGLVGFAWAFLRAGARRVMAGLWDVDDRSTALLMDEVYARIADGAAPATALRDAKLALIGKGFPKPFYWAPFQVFTVVV
ncbi:MAG: CHAT domain-containing protein [Vicinamibacterales bacterium]